jgi:signal peptidase I
MKTNLQGRWSQVAKDFFLVVLVVCTLRWALGEPFLVPSGSMIPTLLIKDYILVSKFSYGLRIPFTKTWLWGPRLPSRGDVVVFRSKEDNYYFMVKRVVGLPGDTIVVGRAGQRLLINGQEQKQVAQPEADVDGALLSMETLGEREHIVRYDPDEDWQQEQEREFIVPEGHIFLMGDNRDRSSDSRIWGALPVENLLGKAQFIWMSCKEEAPAASVFCLGEDMRQDRVFTKIR